MRVTLLSLYQTLLRMQGAIMLGFVVLLLVGAIISDLPGLRHPVPIGAAILAAAIAAMFTLTRFTPRSICDPSGLPSGLMLAALHAIAPFVFMVPIMMSVVALEIDEPTSRTLAVGASAAVFLMSAALWCMGLVLSIWGNDPVQSTAEAFPREGFDFRDAR